jgi:hypothetical protein
VSEVETAKAVPGVSLSRAVLRQQLATLAVPARTAAILAGQPPGPGHLDAACANAAAVLERLVNALASEKADERVYHEGVRALSGLGPGLTPTGDDLLVALLVAGRHFANGGFLPKAALAQLAQAVASSPPDRTTPVAEGFLREARSGHAPAPLARFVAALGSTDVRDDDLAERCARLVETGAHSGADWLAGVLVLSACCCEPEGVQPCTFRTFHVPIRKPDVIGRGTLPSPLSPLPCPLESHRD